MKITIRKLDNKLVTWNGGNDSSDPLLEEIDIEQDSLPQGDFNRMFYENGILLIKEFSLDEVKQKRNDYITESFEEEFISGVFKSTTLNIDVDCRRNSTKNDLQNVDNLIDYMTDNSIPQIQYKGFGDKALATVDQLKLLKKEMQTHGVGLYNKKDVLRAQIKNCTTIEQVEAIVW